MYYLKCSTCFLSSLSWSVRGRLACSFTLEYTLSLTSFSSSCRPYSSSPCVSGFLALMCKRHRPRPGKHKHRRIVTGAARQGLPRAGHHHLAEVLFGLYSGNRTSNRMQFETEVERKPFNNTNQIRAIFQSRIENYTSTSTRKRCV